MGFAEFIFCRIIQYINSCIAFQLFAHCQIIRHVTTDHPPKIRAVVSYLNVAKFVDDHIIKTGLRSFYKIQIEGDSPCSVRIATPTRFHGANGYGRQRDSFFQHPVVAFD
ncbi:MAG: hypothetical protein A2X85_11805 [Geobacteraceae bacterium GWF2_54_21]|nr:MAG: hypothetical protein A2X85_11805 [Geobacteraceae bacterium GWF2_54_21]